MKTKIYKIDENEINSESLDFIAEELRSGKLVAIPTETVYGLGANGLDPAAVKKIFVAKNRPMDNPLILHIAEIDQIGQLTKNVNQEDLDKLERLWPGPLTVIFEKSDIIPDEVSCGLDTVAIRIPNHKICHEFLKSTKVPVAAPSANLSTKPSPTRAQDVIEDMDGRIDYIIDGGPCEIGLESTVLDLSSENPTILRPGYYTKEGLSSYWPNVSYDTALKDQNQTPKSPGQKYKHYAPNAQVEVYIGNKEAFKKIVESKLEDKSKKIGIMAFEEDKVDNKISEYISLGSINDLSTMGQKIFTSLREMDHKEIDLILIHGVEEKSFGISIMNRLRKSASGRVFNLEEIWK